MMKANGNIRYKRNSYSFKKKDKILKISNRFQFILS